jgi:hypothetical protein
VHNSWSGVSAICHLIALSQEADRLSTLSLCHWLVVALTDVYSNTVVPPARERILRKKAVGLLVVVTFYFILELQKPGFLITRFQTRHQIMGNVINNLKSENLKSTYSKTD